MADIKGRAIVWAIGTQTFTGGIVSSTADGFKQKLDFTKTADSAEIKSEGETATKIWSNQKNILAISVVPCAVGAGNTTITSAMAACRAWMPDPGAGVTITEATTYAGPGLLTASQTGHFTVVDSKLGMTFDGAATVDLTLEQYKTNDLSMSAS